MQGFDFEEQAGGPQPGDERLFVQFFDGVRKDKAASEEAGRPIFKTVPWVKILIPGDRNSVVETYADETYIKRFPKQWAAYQAKESQAIQGTLLSDTPLVSRAQLAELEYFKIYTVEQLAEGNDNLATKIPVFHELKRKAQTFVAQAKDSALAQKLGAENDALKLRVGQLEGEIGRLSQMFDAAVKGATSAPQPEHQRGEQHRSRNRPAGV